MGFSKLEESCVFLDEEVLRYMDLLELLQEKRSAFNSLIEQVAHIRRNLICIGIIQTHTHTHTP